MKKVWMAVLAAVLVFLLVACGKKDPVESGSGQTEEARLPGKLYFYNTDKNPLLSGLSLSGNRSGSIGFNAKKAAAEGIRCIFELSEWVEIYPETDIKDGLQVWVLQHQKDGTDFEKAGFSDQMPGYMTSFDLEAAGEGEMWGSFYLNPDDAEEGYYDIVFTRNGKAGAVLLTYFYQQEELNGKTDAELEQLMSGLKAQ